MTSSARPGRPRHVPESGTAMAPREQILDAAAELFVEHGFAGTSTRMIAEKVGMRQASMYYHFAGKDEIVVELLAASVRPSLEVVRSLPADASPAAALWALVTADVDTLASTPHNIGILYLLPELQHPRYAPFHAERDELRAAYGRLAAAAAEPAAQLDPDTLGALLIQLVEVVISARRTGEVDAALRDAIAVSCLRVCGLDERRIAAARRERAAGVDAGTAGLR